MKQSFKFLFLFIVFSFFAKMEAMDPVSTTYVGSKILYAAGVGILYGGDKLYRFYSKHCLDPIVQRCLLILRTTHHHGLPSGWCTRCEAFLATFGAKISLSRKDVLWRQME